MLELMLVRSILKEANSLDLGTKSMLSAWLVRMGDSRGESLISVSISSKEFKERWKLFTQMPDFNEVKNKFMESVKL